jgi:hypothetical protein
MHAIYDAHPIILNTHTTQKQLKKKQTGDQCQIIKHKPDLVLGFQAVNTLKQMF